MFYKASVIVPVYNGKEHISKCIASIFNQTCSELELIIIDDGSKDDSYDIIEQYVADNKPDWCDVKLIKQENQGVSETRNKGIDLASGKYVFFVDQDDVISENYCKNYILEAEKNDSDIVVGGYERVSDIGKVLRSVIPRNYRWFSFFVVSPWAHVYKRDFLVEKSIRFLTTKIGEDIYFNILAYANTDKITILSGNTDYKWVNNMESVSNSKQNAASKEKSPIYLLKMIHKNLPEKNYIPEDIREYYFLRYVIWYLIFTVRGTKKEVYYEVMDELYDWLNEEYPRYQKNRYIIHKPKGESVLVSIAVKLLTVLRLFGIDKVFLGMFTKRR